MESDSKTLEWSSLSIREVLQDGFRLDASVYNAEGVRVRHLLSQSNWPSINLGGENGLATISYPGRFKRIFLKHSDFPIFRPSQITDLRPRADLYLSDKTPTNLDALRVKYGQILMTRSGTIGKCTLVTSSYNNAIFSDDLLRIDFKNPIDSGYTYAFLQSEIGRTLITTNNYGAVIQHVEPLHLDNIKIPNPDLSVKKEISELVYSSFEKRDEANRLIDQAEHILKKALNLPDMVSFENVSSADIHSISVHKLQDRFEATYHRSEINSLIQHLKSQDATMSSVKDDDISQSLILPGRFKRVYVEEGQGIVFFGGKQIYELDPSNKKYLSRSLHSTRISEQLTLKENMVLVTCSGTIGKVQIAPKHWDGWTANQHILRIVPANIDIAGYLYLWLQSEYGEALIKRFSYGAVVDELDDTQLGEVLVPILNDKNKVAHINQLVLDANKLRYEAYKNEQKAIEILYSSILTTEA